MFAVIQTSCLKQYLKNALSQLEKFTWEVLAKAPRKEFTGSNAAALAQE